MNYKKVLGIIVLLLVVGFAYYAISPLFTTIKLDEPEPETLQTEKVIESGFDDLSEEDQVKMLAKMEAKNNEDPVVVEDKMPEKTDEAVTEAKEERVAAAPTVASVMGTRGHPASGTVRVIQTTDGAVIRYEDFETINGPRLHVYLAKDVDGKEFIDLGPIKGTSGNINYTVPEGVDIAEYPYVLHWCVPFSVLFNYANIGV